MNQAGLAKSLGITPIWWCAIVNGRGDAGKDLAVKASEQVGGTTELWMLKKYRPKRKKLVGEYLNAVKKARNGGLSK